MTDKLRNLLISKAEELGWGVHVDGRRLQFQKYSPAGEDFWLSINGRDVVRELLDYYECFDTEDHVMMHMEGKKHGVAGIPSLKELVADADAIDEMIEELYTPYTKSKKLSMRTKKTRSVRWNDCRNHQMSELRRKRLTRHPF